MAVPDNLEYREKEYCNRKSLDVIACLGQGTQGNVLLCKLPSLNDRTAVKFHDRQVAYQRERDVYIRLRALEVSHVLNHRVPLLLDHNDEFLALEMTVVSPPFVLDFGGAYLDRRPDYSPEVWEDWRTMKQEQFDINWPAVERILSEFESMGIFIADVNPGNIRFS